MQTPLRSGGFQNYCDIPVVLAIMDDRKRGFTLQSDNAKYNGPQALSHIPQNTFD